MLNSKSEWNHCKIPRVVLEIGDEVEEDEADGMTRSTEMGGRERRKGGMKIKKLEKRNNEEIKEGDHKRQKVEGNNDRPAEMKQKKKVRKVDSKKVQNEREDLESRGRLLEWMRLYGVSERTREIRGVGEHLERMEESREKQ